MLMLYRILTMLVYYGIFAINTLIVIRVILSWLSPNSSNGFTDLIYGATEPILRPFRVLVPMGSVRFDFSPVIAYIFFLIVRKVLFIGLGIIFGMFL